MTTGSVMRPLVSCVMPTADRRGLVSQAIRLFVRQDYPNRELVIVDDGVDGVGDLVPEDPRIRYVRLTGRRVLGAKRNECVEASRGELILHWDDDDWMAPHRISTQVAALLANGAEVCGLTRLLFHEAATGRTWLYAYPEQWRGWLAGGSMLYTRDFWRRGRFPASQVGSDTRFAWTHDLRGAAVVEDLGLYVALVHPGNTSPKHPQQRWWSPWAGRIEAVIGPDDLPFYLALGEELRATGRRALAQPRPVVEPGAARPEYAIVMVVHNALAITQASTLATLRHSAGERARLVVVDNASDDGVQRWLDLLERRGDIDLIRNTRNLGHGPGLEQGRNHSRAPFLVTLDSDAHPLSDSWLTSLRRRLTGKVKVVGIPHHRGYVHPSCLMVARQTLDELQLSFLDGHDGTRRLDVAERLSREIKRRGFRIDELARTADLGRGSTAEPVYLGAEYEGLVRHQWYTTRATISPGGRVDDVPAATLRQALDTVLERLHREHREVTVVVGVRALPAEPDRLCNAVGCLRALNLQDLERWRYRILLVEQDGQPRLREELASLVDRYVFAYNPGPYNRGWAFNIGARMVRDTTEALCLIDADLLVGPGFLRRGLEALRAGGGALQPFARVVYLDAAESRRAMAERERKPLGAFSPAGYRGRTFTTSQGGCLWVDLAVYEAVGGHDERFRGWGGEDREFWARLARATPIRRIEDTMLHLYHPPPRFGDEVTMANQRLLAELEQQPDRRPAAPIGDLDRYAGEGPAGVEPGRPGIGRRDWEHWNRWSDRRIRQIVRGGQTPAAAGARRQLAELLRGLGDSLLDVGCGPGMLWPYLEPFRPGFSWAGLDATEAMVAAARELFPSVPAHHGDAGDLPFDDGSFDVVLLRHVLEHLPEWLLHRALGEAMRVAATAVCVDFYVPPTADGERRTRRVGEGFLETRWTVVDIVAPVQQAGWYLADRVSILPEDPDARHTWVLRRPAPGGAAGAPAQRAVGTPKVSIVMPTFRRGHTIARTIAGIQAQTYPNWELVIVDNAGDPHLAFDDDRIRVYRHTGQTSASYARNQGLRHAKGELICFFDDDDDMFPNYLERFVDAFLAHPQAKMVRCGMVVSDGTTNFTYATPECCLRREFATANWPSMHSQDQAYFGAIVASHGWSEAAGDIVVISEALCRANADPRGGLRVGRH
jgi:glycosyltransferase involved in cell wall biosynthesis